MHSDVIHHRDCGDRVGFRMCKWTLLVMWYLWHSISATCGPRDIISLVIPQNGHNIWLLLGDMCSS
jgi:hypothetical protein